MSITGIIENSRGYGSSLSVGSSMLLEISEDVLVMVSISLSRI